MSAVRRTREIKRRAFCAAAVVAALATAGPVAEASAATPALQAATSPTLASIGGLEALPFIYGGATYAKGPTVIGDAFNGGTTVCVSTAASACSTNAAP
jgi:hypothetical protein